MAKVTLDLIQQLRQRTGIGMMSCKKALTESNGDIEKAIVALRKKGAALAAKRAGNKTTEGFVHTYIHPGSRIGVILEMNCETDFVARTDDIKQFAHDVCMHIAAINPLYLNSDSVDSVWLEKEKEIIREQLLKSGKPEAMIDKIMVGKLKKLFSDACLMDQAFIKNDKLTINELLESLIAKLGENIKIKRFVRFEIGQ